MNCLTGTLWAVLFCLQLGSTASADETIDASEKDKRAETVACQARLSQALLAEGTPLMEALAVLQYPSRDLGGSALVAVQSERLRKIAQNAPDDVLVQWLAAVRAASANPVGLSAAAEALLRLEPDNGAAWLFPLQSAWNANDSEGVTEALAHISRANRFDQHFGDVTVSGLEFFKEHSIGCWPYLKSSRPTMLGFRMARDTLFWPAGHSEIDRMCGGFQEPLSVARANACIAAGRRIVEVAAMPRSRRAGNYLLKHVATDEYSENEQNIDYLWHEYSSVSIALDSDDNQYQLYEMDWLATHSGIKVLERALQRDGKPSVRPENWKVPILSNSERLDTIPL